MCPFARRCLSRAFTAGVIAVASAGAAQPREARTLRGVSAVHVVVEQQTTEPSESHESVNDRIRSAIENRLREHQIAVQDSANADLQIWINSVKRPGDNEAVFICSVRVVQDVIVASNNEKI